MLEINFQIKTEERRETGIKNQQKKERKLN